MTETTAVAAAMATCMNERSIRGAIPGGTPGFTYIYSADWLQ